MNDLNFVSGFCNKRLHRELLRQIKVEIIMKVVHVGIRDLVNHLTDKMNTKPLHKF